MTTIRTRNLRAKRKAERVAAEVFARNRPPPTSITFQEFRRIQVDEICRIFGLPARIRRSIVRAARDVT